VYVIRGTVYGYTGDGSGITVTAHLASTEEEVGSGITFEGGGFCLSWPDGDGTTVLYASATQPPHLEGRSLNDVAEWQSGVLVGGEYESEFDRDTEVE
jgi:hypothetical protein